MNAIVTTGSSVPMLADAETYRVVDRMVDSFLDFDLFADGEWSAEGARHSLRHDLPARQDVAAALGSLQRDIDTPSPAEKRLEIVGLMLDVQSIDGNEPYIRFLALKLEQFPMQAIARAIDEVLCTMRPEGGRPVPVSDILAVAKRHAHRLVQQRDALRQLDRTVIRLELIADGKQPPKPNAGDDDDDVPF